MKYKRTVIPSKFNNYSLIVTVDLHLGNSVFSDIRFEQSFRQFLGCVNVAKVKMLCWKKFILGLSMSL